MTGETGHALRGDYSRMRPDYTVEQDWDAYSQPGHELWRRLYRRQESLVAKYACDEFNQALEVLDFSQAIPRFDAINKKLASATGWQLVAVPGLVPDLTFFEHLANRRFPVTVWLREPEEFDYIVEPDIFHDFFGHVPMLFNPVFADYMQAYGEGGLKALGLGALDNLARLYWYTVEFGLIRTTDGLRIYGAGILSSKTESVYCLEDKRPKRLPFDLMRIMRTGVKIDDLQRGYFVIDSFEQLFAATEADFAPYYATLRRQPAISPGTVLPGEREIAPAAPSA